MGRPRKPLNELKLHGGFRADRHSNRLNEPQFDGVPHKPRGFDPEAAKLWDRIVPKLVNRGIAKEIDTPILTMACEVWALYVKSMRLAQANPTDKDIRCAVMSYASQFDKLAAHCGLNPQDRAKLSVPPKPDDGDDIEAFSRKRGRA